jgi:hypothetical protein
MRPYAWFVLVAACSGGNSNKPIDAAIDAPPDSPPDALIDAPMPPPGEHRYVIDRESIPQNNNEARMLGLDLNGDGTVDNQLGMVLASVSSLGLSTQTTTDTAIDKGGMIVLADVHADDVTTGVATFTLYTGANPMPAACSGASDTTCRHHLMGTATFDVPATSAHDTPLAGTIGGGVFTTTTPGTLHLPTIALSATPTALQLIGARVKLTMFTDGTIGPSIVAGGVPATEIDQKVIPGMQAALMAVVMHDCTDLAHPPTCGCADGSSGKTILGLFDAAPKDCMVSVDELKNNQLLKSLLAPDVTIDGQQCLSLGVGIHAVHAAFTP